MNIKESWSRFWMYVGIGNEVIKKWFVDRITGFHSWVVKTKIKMENIQKEQLDILKNLK